MSGKQHIESLGKAKNSANSVTGIELEKGQLLLLKAIKHVKHEEVMEFVLFLGEFHRYLTGLSKPKYNSKVDEWLKLLSKYTKMFGLPQDALAYINMSRMNRRTTALVYALEITMKHYRKVMQVIRDERECEDVKG